MCRTTKTLLGLVLVAGLVASCGHVELKPKAPDWSVYLRRTGFTGDLGELPLIRQHRVAQVSSFDRAGGNADDAGYVAQDDNHTILADVKGPGCILRMWSANPYGRLRLFIDDDWPPLMDFPFESLFEGRVKPFRKPLVGMSSGGHYCYFPIFFRERCIVEIEGKPQPHYYQITYAKFDDAGDTRSFAGELSPRDRTYIRQLVRSWRNPGRPAAPRNCLSVEGTYDIWPGAAWEIASLPDAGVIRSLWLNPTARDAEVTQQIYLLCYWDGEEAPSVTAPIGSFFGTGFEEQRFRSVPVGMRKDGLYCRFLMPFNRGARLVLENRGKRKVDMRWAVDYSPTSDLPTGVGKFHAQGNEAITKSGVPYTILETSGMGQYVGCVLSIDAKNDFGFLEGDETIYVDGEREHSIHGTGTEDYFNGAYYFAKGIFELPWHGCTVKDWGERRRISAYRFHITDYVPFSRSFQMTVEHGGKDNAPGLHYSSVAFWYEL